MAQYGLAITAIASASGKTLITLGLLAALKAKGVWLNPLSANEKPPLRPSAMSKYKDKNRAIALGISKFERTSPANKPNTKNKTLGSNNGLELMIF